MTNSSNLNDVVSYKVFHFINNEDQDELNYKILWCTNVVASHRENEAISQKNCDKISKEKEYSNPGPL